MDNTKLVDDFLKVDEELRRITTGGTVSYNDQELIINKIVECAIADPVCDPQNEGIAHDGPLGIDLHDETKTAYFSEAQFRILDVTATHRYLATTGVANCLAVFVSSPTGRSFGAHLNLVSLYYSMEEAKAHGGGVFQNMVDALKNSFKNSEPCELSVHIVGGWIHADLGTKGKQKFERTQKQMWSFSGEVVECIKQALPGAKIDTSKMNIFQGVSWENRNQQTKLKCIVQGDAYRIAVLDSHTGKVYVQQTNLGDFCIGKGCGVMFPEWVLISSLTDLAAMHMRVAKFKKTLATRVGHESILQEYIM